MVMFFGDYHWSEGFVMIYRAFFWDLSRGLYRTLARVIPVRSTKKPPFTECIIPFITS